MAVIKISLDNFLRDFKERHEQQKELPFCFVLGSGASYESGIPTGALLVDQWLKRLWEDGSDRQLPIERWATAANLGIQKFNYERRSEFYGEVYERRFRGRWDAGFIELERAFEKKEPSFGYSVLSWILAETQHRVVITPNFDNLVADALALYSDTAPIVCLHENLAGYVTHKLHRPLVVKIHRDLYFDPKSRQQHIAELPGRLCEALVNLLRNCTPVFIGYGGNDPGFMDFLKNLPEGVPDRIYWCQREAATCNARILEFLDRRDGNLVTIPGFDLLMLRLRQTLGIPDFVAAVDNRHAARMERYRKSLVDLTSQAEKQAKSPDATVEEKENAEAAVAVVQQTKVEDTPQSWLLRAQAEPNPDKAEAIYREALAKYPQDTDVLLALAEFLADRKQCFDEAERLLKTACETAPGNPDCLRAYGMFLRDSRRDGQRAELFLQRAIEIYTWQLGAEHPVTLRSRTKLAGALYLQNKHKEAEQESRAVLAIQERVLGPEHPGTLASRLNLALALESRATPEAFHEAIREYRALLLICERVLGPKDPESLSLKIRNNLAAALHHQGKFSEAEVEHRAVLAIRKEVLGEKHPAVLISCFNLGMSIDAQDRPDEALTFLQMGEKGWIAMGEPKHPEAQKVRAARIRIEARLKKPR
ncbi:MAG TPA: tetratricopeptide repeat protein [Opitutaceae bacterium]|nr:tetratricopeptide repeat protein [Opitutaceae bacterium]